MSKKLHPVDKALLLEIIDDKLVDLRDSGYAKGSEEYEAVVELRAELVELLG